MNKENKDKDRKNQIAALYNHLDSALKFFYFHIINLVDEKHIKDKFTEQGYALARKFSEHLFSLFNLSQGIEINNPYDENKTIKIYDKDSVISLYRDLIENYLTFHSIFVSPKTEEEGIFRFNVYSYCDNKLLYDRTQELFNDEELNEINNKIDLNYDQNDLLNQIKSKTDYYYESFLNNPLFGSLTNSQKNKLEREYPDWKVFGSWYEMAEEASFRKSRFDYDYSLLSSSSHSGAIGTIYNYQNKLTEIFIDHINNTIYCIHLILCKFILEFSEFFNLKDELKKEPEIFAKIKEDLHSGIVGGFFTNKKGLAEYISQY